MPAQNTSLAPRDRLFKEQDEWKTCPPTSALIAQRILEFTEQLIREFRDNSGSVSFFDSEKSLISRIFGLGRLFIALFLCARHERAVADGLDVGHSSKRRRQLQPRLLGTFFGKVRFWRTYVHGRSGGSYPLDRLLGLPSDGFSLVVTGLMAFLATKVSYAQVTQLLKRFLGWSPSQTTVESAVLGLGARSRDWVATAPVEREEGRILVIMVDSKATPTATESELAKRRRKRGPKSKAPSPRHRQRKRRGSWERKHRKPGDKSKNGKAATVVVMYSLEPGTDSDGKPVLKGPFNLWKYASYAPKRHAFAIARRQADRRGFSMGSGNRVHIVTDGDTDLEAYAKELFPGATHALDVIHATEYLWKAGRVLFQRAPDELETWVVRQRDLLYDGKAKAVVANIEAHRDAIPKTGPGNKAKRKDLLDIANYLEKRIGMMRYREWIDEDLDISSGAVEGAVRHVVAQRFDCGGMRWIRERSEALLQLRCIELNGQWDAFLEFVQKGLPKARTGPGVALLSSSPQPLPTFGLAA